MLLHCPKCDDRARLQDYPTPHAHPRYCWNCLCTGQGWVEAEVLEKLVAGPPAKQPGKRAPTSGKRRTA